MKPPGPTPTMTAAGLLHYSAFLSAHFHSMILAECRQRITESAGRVLPDLTSLFNLWVRHFSNMSVV